MICRLISTLTTTREPGKTFIFHLKYRLVLFAYGSSADTADWWTTWSAERQRAPSIRQYLTLHTTLFTFWKGRTIIRKKNESENLTNQQHETLKRYLAHYTNRGDLGFNAYTQTWNRAYSRLKWNYSKIMNWVFFTCDFELYSRAIVSTQFPFAYDMAQCSGRWIWVMFGCWVKFANSPQSPM